MYKAAMREIKNGWFDWCTGLLELKLGWSFAKKLYTSKLFLCVLKSTNLNRIPKTDIAISELWTDWQIQTTNKYFGRYKP